MATRSVIFQTHCVKVFSQSRNFLYESGFKNLIPLQMIIIYKAGKEKLNQSSILSYIHLMDYFLLRAIELKPILRSGTKIWFSRQTDRQTDMDFGVARYL